MEFISPQTVLGNVIRNQNIYKLYFVHEKFDIGYFVIREEAIPRRLTRIYSIEFNLIRIEHLNCK